MASTVGFAAFLSFALKLAIAFAKLIQVHYRGEEQTQNNTQPFKHCGCNMIICCLTLEVAPTIWKMS
jgi:hypothetical protein